MKSCESQGFTLVEMMITLAILVIAASFAVPSLNGYFGTLRLRSSTRQLYSDMVLAKITAMKTLTNHAVRIGGANGTKQGWMVFEDKNANGSYDTGEKIISETLLTDQITVNSGMGTVVSFDREGFIIPPGRTFVLQSNLSKTLSLSISVTGYMRIF